MLFRKLRLSMILLLQNFETNIKIITITAAMQYLKNF